ncbi:MAG: hypothetical protein IKO72_08625 [Kiritimatiellae bacterium]|nr:hypothetical protein [Kiritimatiellia bacterium]
MELKVRFNADGLARDILSIVGSEGRRELFSVAANALRILVQRHIRAAAPTRHVWATILGGRRTGHLTKGARLVTAHATPTYGVVEVPIPGISRAFQDLTITPRTADMLTIPARGAGGISYGHRAAEMQALGWRLFRGKGSEKARHLLFGRKERDTRILYVLKERVTVPMDRGLLPSDGAVENTTREAMEKEIVRVCRKVCRAAG